MRLRRPAARSRARFPAGFEATFRYALLDPDADVAAEAAAFRAPFAHLALLVQIPGVDVVARVESEKGSALTARERAILDERLVAARAWLDAYAPEAARLAVHRDAVPAEAERLDPDQTAFLLALADAATTELPAGGDDWQSAIFAAASGMSLPAGRAFAALYLAFLGRTNGPRAGWLLASLDPRFVVTRLRDAAGAAAVGGADATPVGGAA